VCFIYCFKKFLTSFFLGGGAWVGSFWVFEFFLGSVVRRNLRTKRSANFCFDDQAFYDSGEFDAVVVVLPIFVSMIKLSSRRRI
jgi:hypothetical protein